MIVLVTGSRNWTDEPTITAALDAAATECLRLGDSRLVVRHGACPPGRPRSARTEKGADAIADEWCRRRAPIFARRGLEILADRHPAVWRGPRGEFRRGAGFERNREMVDHPAGPDRCYAFNRHKADGEPSGGTAHCADYAERRGVPVTRWEATHESPRGRLVEPRD